eukprot:7544883-Heterocapsa_arctica.AAC.1
MLHPLPGIVGQLRVDALPCAPRSARQSNPDDHREASRVALDHDVDHSIKHIAEAKIVIW